MSPYSEIELRLAELQKWVIRGLVFMVVVAVSGVFVAAWVVHSQNDRIEYRANKSDQALACYIRDQLDRSVIALPSNGYYKTHPDDLEAAFESIRVQRANAIATWGTCEKPRSTH